MISKVIYIKSGKYRAILDNGVTLNWQKKKSFLEFLQENDIDTIDLSFSDVNSMPEGRDYEVVKALREAGLTVNWVAQSAHAKRMEAIEKGRKAKFWMTYNAME